MVIDSTQDTIHEEKNNTGIQLFIDLIYKYKFYHGKVLKVFKPFWPGWTKGTGF